MRFTLVWGTISKTVFLVISILLLSTCSKKEYYKNIDVIAHAASGLYNPRSFFVDNTVDAVNYALGFEDLDGIEIDIQFSNDGTLWMFHDILLNNRTNGDGPLCSHSDGYLNSIEYDDLNSTKLSKFSDVNWTLINGSKTIYLDVKNLNTLNECQTYDILDFIDVLNNVSFNNPKITFVPVISNDSVAEVVYSEGYEVFTDVTSYSQAKSLETSFYSGFFIRQRDIESTEIKDLQSSGKNIILFDMFSLSSLKKAFKKAPNGIMAEDFKSAIIEKN